MTLHVTAVNDVNVDTHSTTNTTQGRPVTANTPTTTTTTTTVYSDGYDDGCHHPTYGVLSSDSSQDSDAT